MQMRSGPSAVLFLGSTDLGPVGDGWGLRCGGGGDGDGVGRGGGSRIGGEEGRGQACWLFSLNVGDHQQAPVLAGFLLLAPGQPI